MTRTARRPATTVVFVARRLRLLILLVALFAAACSSDATDDGGDSDAGTSGSESGSESATADLETTPEVPGAPLNPFDLRSGQCFNEGSWYDEVLERRIDLTASVDCAQPHQKEVFHEAEFPAPNGAPYPGETKMTEWSTQLCYDAFDDFVNAEYELSIFEIDFLQPTRETFEHPVGRHRRVTCFLYNPAEDMVTGSARGAGI